MERGFFRYDVTACETKVWPALSEVHVHGFDGLVLIYLR